MNDLQDAKNLSVVLITLNEEKRIVACIQSLPRGSELVVLDSGSTDQTVALAKSLGARVETRAFTNHCEQKNAAIALATRPWILSIDADEVMTDELRGEVVRVTNDLATLEAGFHITRRLVFMGRLMRFGKTSDAPLRLFVRGRGHFESAIHEKVVVTTGKVGACKGTLLHYSYDDLTDYFRRFNSYTSSVAENHDAKGKAMPPLLAHVLRPWVEFVTRYILRLGFLDGYPGYTYALLSSLYTYVKYAKLKERQEHP